MYGYFNFLFYRTNNFLVKYLFRVYDKYNFSTEANTVVTVQIACLVQTKHFLLSYCFHSPNIYLNLSIFFFISDEK